MHGLRRGELRPLIEPPTPLAFPLAPPPPPRSSPGRPRREPTQKPLPQLTLCRGTCPLLSLPIASRPCNSTSFFVIRVSLIIPNSATGLLHLRFVYAAPSTDLRSWTRCLRKVDSCSASEASRGHVRRVSSGGAAATAERLVPPAKREDKPAVEARAGSTLQQPVLRVSSGAAAASAARFEYAGTREAFG